MTTETIPTDQLALVGEICHALNQQYARRFEAEEWRERAQKLAEQVDPVKIPRSDLTNFRVRARQCRGLIEEWSHALRLHQHPDEIKENERGTLWTMRPEDEHRAKRDIESWEAEIRILEPIVEASERLHEEMRVAAQKRIAERKRSLKGSRLARVGAQK